MVDNNHPPVPPTDGTSGIEKIDNEIAVFDDCDKTNSGLSINWADRETWSGPDDMGDFDCDGCGCLIM